MAFDLQAFANAATGGRATPQVSPRDALLMQLSGIAGGPQQRIDPAGVGDLSGFENFSRVATQRGFDPLELVGARNQNIGDFQGGGFARSSGEFFDETGLSKVLTYGPILTAAAGAAGAFGGAGAGGGGAGAGAGGSGSGGFFGGLATGPTATVTGTGGGGGFFSGLGKAFGLGGGGSASGGGGVALFDKVLSGLGIASDIFGQVQQGRTQDRALDQAAFQDPRLSLGGINVGGGQTTLPPFLQAIQGLSGANAVGVLGGTNFADQLSPALSGALSGITAQGSPNLATRSGFLDQLAASGTNLLANFGGPLSQRGEGTRANVLDIMRQQAAPGQERAVTSQLERLFGTGNLGTTGGNERREALGNVLTQQDLGFQQAAFGEGRAQDTLENQLINSAFNRFNQTSGVLGSLSGQAFDRERLADQFGFGRAQDIFGTLSQASTIPTALAGGRLTLTNQLLQQGFGGPQQFGLDAFRAALDQERVRTGAGSAVLQGTLNPGFDASPLASAFSALARGQQDRRQLDRLFGGGTGSRGPFDITNQVEI